MGDVGDDAVPRTAVRITAVDWDGTWSIGIVEGTTPDGRGIRAAIGSRTLPLIVEALRASEVVEIVVESSQVIDP